MNLLTVTYKRNWLPGTLMAPTVDCSCYSCIAVASLPFKMHSYTGDYC